jgi:hypothetical protein
MMASIVLPPTLFFLHLIRARRVYIFHLFILFNESDVEDLGIARVLCNGIYFFLFLW